MHITLTRIGYTCVAALILVFQYAPSVPAQQSSPWTGVIANDGLGWGSEMTHDGGLSADARYVVFHTPNPGVPQDGNYDWDIYVRDRHTRAVTRESVASDGSEANSGSVYGKLSGDARHVVFYSCASNLAPGIAPGTCNYFVRDRQAGTTAIASLSPAGEQLNYTRDTDDSAISPDGRFVLFSAAFPSWNSPAIYLRDRDPDGDGTFDEPGAATTTRISVTTLSGTDNLGQAGDPAISPDGRYVAYVALYSNEAGYVGQRVFLHDRDLGTTVRVDRRDQLSPDTFGYSETPDFSATGEIVYASDAPQIVLEDNDVFRDVFVYNIVTQQNARLLLTHAGAPELAWIEKTVISADGRYVAFAGQDNTPEWAINVYAIDRQTGTSAAVSVKADGSPHNESFTPAISDDGASIAFTGNHLLADIFDGPGVYVATAFSVSPAAIEIPAEGGSATVDVTVPPDLAWDAQLVMVDEFSYVTFESHSGTGPGSFDIQIGPNQTGEDRIYRVWLGSKEILVTQAGSPYIYFVEPYYGPSTGGTDITIQGWGFVQGATVTVGGVAATNVVVETSGGTIFATTPPSTVLDFVPVVVTNPNGRSHELEFGFWYQDGTPPVVEANIAGTQGANGWYTSDVLVSWSITDPESEIIGSGCPDVAVTTDTPSAFASCTARSGGGETTMQVEIMRDATPPVATIARPEAVTYTQGQSVALDYSCADGTSGIATCTASQPGGTLDTSTPGTFDFSVTVTDQAGLQTVRTVTYTVKQAATAGLSPASAVYGGSDAVLSATLTANGSGLANRLLAFFVNDTAVGTATTSAAGEASLAVSLAGRPAASHPIRVEFAGDSNTMPASANNVLTIGAASLTITANDAAKVYGEALPAFTASAAGFVNGDTLGSLIGTLSFSTSATATSAPGAYPVTPGGVSSPNYTIAFAAGTLTVARASTAVALSSSPNPSGVNQNVVLTAVVSTVAPGVGTATGAVTFRDNGVVLGTAPLVNGVATLTKKFKKGTHPLTATYAGDANFNGGSGGTTHLVP